MPTTIVQDEIIENHDDHEDALYGCSHNVEGADEADEDEGIDDSQIDGTLSESKRVSIQSADITIFEYKRRLDKGRISLDPDWQRSYVWKNNRASQFIESLLMGLPIPVMFIAKNHDGRNDVIDGIQRLTTCSRFLDNELNFRSCLALKN